LFAEEDMKRCSECGENYDDRVDFCFGDGAILEKIDAPSLKSVPKKRPASPYLAGLEVPDAENFSGFEVPDADGFAVAEPEAAVEPPPEPPVEASAPVASQEAGVSEARQAQEAGNIPVGFIDPPSQSGTASPAAFSEPDEDFDDLDFPSDFGVGDFSGDDFGDGDYTEPTIPAQRPRKSPTVFIAIGLSALVLAMGAKILMGGGSESEGDDSAKVAKRKVPVRRVVEPPSNLQDRQPTVQEPVLEPENPVEAEGEASSEPDPSEAEAPEEAAAIPDIAVVEPPVKAAIEQVSKPEPPEPATQARNNAKEPEPAVDDSPWGAVQAKANSLVKIYSKPSGAIVFVDGRQRGKTPAEIELSDGRHTIRVEKDGYFSEDRNLKVSKPSHLERFKLSARDQRVTVNCYGPDASKVYLDGTVVCAIPGSGTLAVGKHTFRVVTPDRFFKMDLVVKARADGSPTPLRFTD
jgi:hypothetical protein